MKAWEKRFIRHIYNVLQSQMIEATEVLKRAGVDGLKLSLDRLVFTKDIFSTLRDVYMSVSKFYARKTMSEINVSSREEKAGFGFDAEWTEKVIEYIRKYLLDKAVLPISQTTKEQILHLLEIGEREGWSIDRMVFELENSDITLHRARMIIRTELLKAQALGRELGEDSSPFEQNKQWISAKDHRTRHSHRKIDGETIDVNGKFKVDRYKGERLVGFDMMEGPGDPKAHAENVINCRCTLAVIAARDENGRLIRKKSKISVISGEQFVRRERVITI